MKKIDLSWGNSIAVRKAFLDNISNNYIVLGKKELANLDYPSHDGNEYLISLTERVIERQIGNKYKHIILTNGAAGGITIALRAYNKMGFNQVYTLAAPYFPIYPSMIDAAGSSHVMGPKIDQNTVALFDSPSNPRGTVLLNTKELGIPVIWDAVYHNRVYTHGMLKPIDHDILVGSYSKLTGLNGIRIGFIATDNTELFKIIKELVTAEYCGLGNISSDILIGLLDEMEINNSWSDFEIEAKYALDGNRDEWSKLTRYFGGQDVNPLGMFYYAEMDNACKKLMEKSNIIWTKGSILGTDDSFGRFNLGQDTVLIKKAVKEILKNDKA